MKPFRRGAHWAPVLAASWYLIGCSPAPTDNVSVATAAEEAAVAPMKESLPAAVIEAESVAPVQERWRRHVAKTSANAHAAEELEAETPAPSDLGHIAALHQVLDATPSPAPWDNTGADLVELAENGDVDAQLRLALAHEDNLEESNKWFLQAAENGHPDAQLQMALRYHHGEGVEQDDEKANYWLSLAEESLGQSGRSTPNVVIVKPAKPRFAPRKVLGLAGAAHVIYVDGPGGPVGDAPPAPAPVNTPVQVADNAPAIPAMQPLISPDPIPPSTRPPSSSGSGSGVSAGSSMSLRSETGLPIWRLLENRETE